MKKVGVRYESLHNVPLGDGKLGVQDRPSGSTDDSVVAAQGEANIEKGASADTSNSDRIALSAAEFEIGTERDWWS